MLKYFLNKLPNICFLIVFIFLFSQVTYASVSGKNLKVQDTVKIGINDFNYNFDPLYAISNDSHNPEQGSKVIISRKGKVLSSYSPNIEKGANLLDFWENAKIFDLQGEKVGSLGNLSETFFKDYNILLFVNRTSKNFGILKAVWSSANNQVTANAQTLEQIELDIFSQELGSSDCETAVLCVIEAVFSASGAFSVCSFEGGCHDGCERIGDNLKKYKENIERELCQDVGTIIGSITDEADAIAATTIILGGCLVGCRTPLIKGKLKKICDDEDKVEKILAKIACSLTAEEEGKITNGIATDVGNDGNNSSISITGEFSYGEQIDFANSTVRVDKALSETMGAGELIRENSDVVESFLFPVILHPEGTLLEIIQTNSDTFIYESPEGFIPYFQMIIERNGMEESNYTFTLDISNASIPGVPQLCDESTLLTQLVTSFVIDDDINTPLSITATEQWDCDSVEPEMLSIGLEQEPDTIGSGCSLTGKGGKTSSDLFLLFILFPLVFRLRRFRERK